MVYRLNDDELDLVFHALADRTRRHILARLAHEELVISELARTYDITLVAVSKHIKVLERAQLVVTNKEGRVHRCTMRFEPLEKASRQIDFYKKFWTKQLDGLDRYVQQVKKKEKKQRRG